MIPTRVIMCVVMCSIHEKISHDSLIFCFHDYQFITTYIQSFSCGGEGISFSSNVGEPGTIWILITLVVGPILSIYMYICTYVYICTCAYIAAKEAQAASEHILVFLVTYRARPYDFTTRGSDVNPLPLRMGKDFLSLLISLCTFFLF